MILVSREQLGAQGATLNGKSNAHALNQIPLRISILVTISEQYSTSSNTINCGVINSIPTGCLGVEIGIVIGIRSIQFGIELPPNGTILKFIFQSKSHFLETTNFFRGNPDHSELVSVKSYRNLAIRTDLDGHQSPWEADFRCD